MGCTFIKPSSRMYLYPFRYDHACYESILGISNKQVTKDKLLHKNITSGNERNHHSNPLTVVDVVISEEFDQSSLLSSSAVIEEPPENDREAYERDRVLEDKLGAQGPVEESRV